MNSTRDLWPIEEQSDESFNAALKKSALSNQEDKQISRVLLAFWSLFGTTLNNIYQSVTFFSFPKITRFSQLLNHHYLDHLVLVAAGQKRQIRMNRGKLVS